MLQLPLVRLNNNEVASCKRPRQCALVSVRHVTRVGGMVEGEGAPSPDRRWFRKSRYSILKVGFVKNMWLESWTFWTLTRRHTGPCLRVSRARLDATSDSVAAGTSIDARATSRLTGWPVGLDQRSTS